jgi:leucyl-tRNA synthetase
MRIKLADAGDSIEDANFEEETAEAQLLRLYTFVDWVKEVLNINQEIPSYRTDDTNYNYYDKVFQSEINRAIQLTEESYEKMLYKDVLKYGYFELQIARDNYRELCSESEGMNLLIIKRFIEVQVLLLAPICPHICDYVYQLLYPGTTIMNARWPTAGKIDQSLIDSCKYLMDTAHDFRIRLESYKIQQSLSPIHATIFVALSYPSWQTFVINELKRLFTGNNHSLPESKILAGHFKDRSEIDKKYQKKLMPFVVYSKGLVEKQGDINALDRHLSFDEYKVLQLNQNYLRRMLDIQQIDIRSTDDPQTDTSMLEDILPGKPFIHFHHC